MGFNVNLGGIGGGSLGAGRLGGGGCGSVIGIFFGILLLPLSFGLLYYGEAKLVNHGVVFARTAMVTAAQAAAATGLVKFRGMPEGEFIEAERFDKPVIYWHKSLEQYETERDSDGDIRHEWNNKDSSSQWAGFSIGGIRIVADKANPVGEETVFTGVRRTADQEFDPKAVDQTPQVGDQRLTIQVIEAGRELIVLGEVTGQVCSGGSSFTVSALNEAATEHALRVEYQVDYWLIKSGAVLALWFGLLCFFGPLMTFVGWIPWLGNRITVALAFGALFVSVAVMGLATVALKFFWVVVAVVAVALVFLTWRGITTPRQRPQGMGAAPPVPPPPAAPPPA